MSEKLLPRYSLSPPDDAPAVLYLHGFLGGRHDWDETVDLIGSRYRHLRVDILDFHTMRSDLPPKTYSMPQCAQRVVDLLDHCAISRCHLVGYSMGGRLGLYLLTRYPGRFLSAVIESGSPGLRTEDERAARRQADALLASRIRKEPMADFVNFWYSQTLFQTMDRSSSRFQALLNGRRNNDTETLALCLEQMGTGAMPSLWDELPQLDNPVLFIAGDRDEKFRRLAGEMATLCPHGRAAIIPDAGHNVHFERPDEYSRALLEFISANQ